MSSKPAWIAALLLVLVLCAWWAVSSYHPQAVPSAQSGQAVPPPVDTHYTAPASVTVHHTVVNGANVYSGSLPIRSCNTFSGGLITSGNNPIHVGLNFKIFDGDGSCLTSVEAQNTPQTFSMSFSSKASTTTPVVDSVSINGTSIPFTVVEGK